MEFRETGPHDDDVDVAARLENLVRLARLGEITGVIAFCVHAQGQLSFTLDGLNHFNVPALAVTSRELISRLERRWFENDVSPTADLRPELRTVDDSISSDDDEA